MGSRQCFESRNVPHLYIGIISYRNYKFLPLVLIFRHESNTHTQPFCCFKIHCNIFFPSTLVFSRLSLPSGFSTKTLHVFAFPHVHATCLTRLKFSLFHNNIWGRVHIYCCSLCNFLGSPFSDPLCKFLCSYSVQGKKVSYCDFIASNVPSVGCCCFLER